MSANQPFIDQKTREAVVTLDAARLRAARERTLLALAHVVTRVQVNHLVKPLPSVRASRGTAGRRAGHSLPGRTAFPG